MVDSALRDCRQRIGQCAGQIRDAAAASVSFAQRSYWRLERLAVLAGTGVVRRRIPTVCRRVVGAALERGASNIDIGSGGNRRCVISGAIPGAFSLDDHRGHCTGDGRRGFDYCACVKKEYQMNHDLSVSNGGSQYRSFSSLLLTFIFVGILSLFLLSYFLRTTHHDSNRYVIDNIDASYHVLLTIKALQSTPFGVHKFLPIVSLGNPEDKNIPWGATVPDSYGNYYYTSFSPLGFFIPYLYFEATGYDLTIENLAFFNMLIHLIATFLFAWVVSVFLTNFGLSSVSRAVAVVSLTLFYIFSNEALYSHGVIYWHHSLFQIFWLTQLIALFKLIGYYGSSPVQSSHNNCFNIDRGNFFRCNDRMDWLFNGCD